MGNGAGEEEKTWRKGEKEPEERSGEEQERIRRRGGED